jgi:hypothetical protein
MKKEAEVIIHEVPTSMDTFYVLGTSPFICNRMSQKAREELLLPKGRKTAAEKATSLKHDPLQEFRASPYLSTRPDSPTLIEALASMFKGAMKTAALDLPGARKTQIGRLVHVIGDRVSLFGVPQLFMSVVRSADMNRTPDVRTRAILPEWCAKVTISYVHSMIRTQSVANLLAAGGVTSGVGDFRPEKGAGNYGSYRVVSEDHPEVRMLMRSAGRDAQEAALAFPRSYDDETDELLSWYNVEVKRRGIKAA